MGHKLTTICHLFSLEISFFEILVNFAFIFGGEAVEIAKIGGENGKREFQGLFIYHIRYLVALLVTELLAVKEIQLFSDFGHILINFCPFPITNSSKIW